MYKFKLLPLLLTMLPFSAFASAPKAPVAPVEKQPVVCTPNYVKNNPDQKACIPPDRNTVGLFVYQPSIIAGTMTGKNTIQSQYKPPANTDDVTWYIYLSGICSLYYQSGYSVACTPNKQSKPMTLAEVVSYYKNWFPNQKIFIGLELGASAINMLVPDSTYSCTGKNAKAYEQYASSQAAQAAEAVVAKLGNTADVAGFMLDMEGTNAADTKNIIGKCGAGQYFANALSNKMPLAWMLNIFAGSPGKLVGYTPEAAADASSQSTVQPPYVPNVTLQYQWNVWQAVNRATRTDCSDDNPCQMGAYIFSLYDDEITFIYKGHSQEFNAGIRDWPFQMKAISNLMHQVNGMPSHSACPKGAPKTEVCLPIKPVGGVISPPYGYYQIGLAVSGSAHDSIAFDSFNGAGAELEVNSTAYWGSSPVATADSLSEITSGGIVLNRGLLGPELFNTDVVHEKGAHASASNALPLKTSVNPARAMTYNKLSCAVKPYSSVSECAFFYQQQQKPEAVSNSDAYYTPLDIMNQYVCTQLNAITYVYSDGSSVGFPSTVCGIGSRTNPTEYLTTENGYELSVVLPFRQAGYDTMIGPALYQISSGGSALLHECYCSSALNQNKKLPKGCSDNTPAWKEKLSSCTLMPGISSIVKQGSNNTWQLFGDWLSKNHLVNYSGQKLVPWYSPMSPSALADDALIDRSKKGGSSSVHFPLVGDIDFSDGG